MAAKHILSLEVLPSSNPELLLINDTSQYAEDIAIDCPEVLIKVPGFTAAKLIKVEPNFNMIISACMLGIQTANCSSERSTLADGIYIIRYSVSPNSKTYVEYNHLRVTDILDEYYKKLCSLDSQPCEPTSEIKKTYAEMSYIKTLIDAAKAKVEYCQSPNEGMELYKFAKRKLSKITCDIC
jgi:hypothetical protein